MPQYTIKDPQSGRTIVLRGDSPPTEAELTQIFAEIDKPPLNPGEPEGLLQHGAAGMMQGLDMWGDIGRGIVKSTGNTVVGLGRLARRIIPGVDILSDLAAGGNGETSLTAAQSELEPRTESEQVGRALEQLVEFAAPGAAATKAASLPARVGLDAATGAGVTAAQGGDPRVGAVAGAVAPLAGAAAGKVGKYLGAKAVPLVRAAIKPTVTQMKQSAGASLAGINAQANKLARFILDNNLANAEQAQTIIEAAEKEVQAAIKTAGNPVTDAPQRAARYLQALQRSASKQGLPARDVATIRAKAAELVEQSGFGETVTETVTKNSPSGLVDASGRPVQVTEEVSRRQLRDGMPAGEALERARATSRWETRKAYGEQKGAEVEASKAVERGARDAVKTSVPATRQALQRQGQAIEARKALDRMEMRTGNRDELSLHTLNPSKVLGAAAHWLRNNQLKAGRYAKTLSDAIARKDVQEVSDILTRLGVGEAVLATNSR